MKKVLAVTLAFCMLSLVPIVSKPVPAFADGNTNNTDTSGTTDTTLSLLNSISFDDIEKEIMARNPTVQANQHLFNSTSSGYTSLDNTVNDLEDSFDTLGDQISGLDTMVTNLENQAFPVILDPLHNAVQFQNISAAPSADDQVLFNNEYNMILQTYKSNVTSLQNSAASLNNQIEQLKSQRITLAGAVAQVKLQTEMINKQLVWAAQNLYTTYNKIMLQQQEQTNNLVLLKRQLEAVTLQESLGMGTAVDVSGLQNKINDLQLFCDNLTNQAAAVKGNLNIFFGQAYDTPLTIQPTPNPDDNKIQTVNFSNDLNDALEASYTIQLESKAVETKKKLADFTYDHHKYFTDFTKTNEDLEGEQVKLADTTRKFSNDFHNTYEDLQSKQKALINEKAKLLTEKTKQDQMTLKHDLGMVSELDFAAAQVAYQSEYNKVQSLQNDLEMAYTKYLWMKAGLSFSSTDGSSN